MPLSNRIEAMVIVFDQGNTLLMDPFRKVMELQKERFCQVCQDRGFSVSGNRIVDEWTRSNREVNYPYIGHFYQEEPIVQHALRNLGVQEDVIAFLGLDLLKEYRIGLQNIVLSDPRTQEVKTTLQTLRNKGKRLGVFSNDRITGLGLVLSAMQIAQLFEYVQTSESIGIEKPNPQVFEHILEHFKVPPHLTVYIGDDPIRDIEAAKKQGLKAIQYRVNRQAYNEVWRDYREKPSYKPDASIGHFSELLDVLQL